MERVVEEMKTIQNQQAFMEMLTSQISKIQEGGIKKLDVNNTEIKPVQVESKKHAMAVKKKPSLIRLKKQEQGWNIY